MIFRGDFGKENLRAITTSLWKFQTPELIKLKYSVN